MEDKLDRILLNQRTIMKNIAYGFSGLEKDDILNQSLLVAIEETEKVVNKDTEELTKRNGE